MVKGEKGISIFPNDMLIFLENSRKLTSKWLTQNCGYKITPQISISFPYTRELKNKKSGGNVICNCNTKHQIPVDSFNVNKTVKLC